MSEAVESAPNIIGRLRRRWGVLAVAFVIGAGAAAAWTLAQPKTELARAAIIMPTDEPSFDALAIFGGKPTPVEYYMGILDSNTVRQQIAKVGKVDQKTLRERYSIQANPVQSQVRLACESESKEVALKMAQTALDELRKVVTQTVSSQGSREAGYLAKAITERERELSAAEQRLVEFAKNAKNPVSPESPLAAVGNVGREKELRIALQRKEQEILVAKTQAKRRAEPSATIPLGILPIEEWRSKVEALEYELSLKRISLGAQAPEIVRLEKSLSVTRQGLQKAVQDYLKASQMELSEDLARLQAERQVLAWELEALSKGVAAAPSEATEYSLLYRNVRFLNESIAALKVQYEKARIKAEVERSRFSILEAPYIDDEPRGKGTARNAVLGGVLFAMIVGLFVAARPDKKA